MKYNILLLFFLFSLGPCSSQTIFKEPYYYIQKDKTVVFSQKKDSIFSRPLRNDKKTYNSSGFRYIMSKDSILNKTSHMVYLKGYNTRNKTKVTERNFKITHLKNNRIRLEIEVGNKRKKINQHLLYPKSELDKLKSIDLITSDEIDTINNEFIDFIKSNYDLKTIDLDNNTIWEKYNDIIMQKGYNPVGAQPILDRAFNKN